MQCLLREKDNYRTIDFLEIELYAARNQTRIKEVHLHRFAESKLGHVWIEWENKALASYVHFDYADLEKYLYSLNLSLCECGSYPTGCSALIELLQQHRLYSEEEHEPVHVRRSRNSEKIRIKRIRNQDVS